MYVPILVLSILVLVLPILVFTAIKYRFFFILIHPLYSSQFLFTFSPLPCHLPSLLPSTLSHLISSLNGVYVTLFTVIVNKSNIILLISSFFIHITISINIILLILLYYKESKCFIYSYTAALHCFL